MNEEQKNKPVAIVLALVLIAVVFALLIYGSYLRKTAPSYNQPSSKTGGGPGITPPPVTPGSTSTPPSNGQQLSVKTKRGDFIAVHNFYPEAKKVLKDQTAVIKSTDLYGLLYFAKTQAFLITLSDQDVMNARAQAEADFLTILQISKDQACALDVSLAVPYHVSDILFGKDYHLSFCPDGVPFVNP